MSGNDSVVTIDWDALPKEAQWVAMDSDSVWCWYKEVPERDDVGWGFGKFSLYLMEFGYFKGPPCDDWTNSLQSRPSPSAANTESLATSASVPGATVVTKKTITETKSVTISRRDIERIVADAVGLSKQAEVTWLLYDTVIADLVEGITITQIKTTEEVA